MRLLSPPCFSARAPTSQAERLEKRSLLMRPVPSLPAALAKCPKCRLPLEVVDRNQVGSIGRYDDVLELPWTLTVQCHDGHTYGWAEGSDRLLERPS